MTSTNKPPVFEMITRSYTEPRCPDCKAPAWVRGGVSYIEDGEVRIDRPFTFYSCLKCPWEHWDHSVSPWPTLAAG